MQLIADLMSYVPSTANRSKSTNEIRRLGCGVTVDNVEVPIEYLLKQLDNSRFPAAGF